MSDWYQQYLTPPTVMEVNARIGAVPDGDHLQALVEVKDPMSGVLLGQWSYPHAEMRNLEPLLVWLCARVREALDANVEPF